MAESGSCTRFTVRLTEINRYPDVRHTLRYSGSWNVRSAVNSGELAYFGHMSVKNPRRCVSIEECPKDLSHYFVPIAPSSHSADFPSDNRVQERVLQLWLQLLQIGCHGRGGEQPVEFSLCKSRSKSIPVSFVDCWEFQDSARGPYVLWACIGLHEEHY